MANKRIAHRRILLEPLNPILLVCSTGTIEIPIESVTIERVGEKAFGLSCLPKPWTLPFIVVSHELLSLYNGCRVNIQDQLINRWIVPIVEAAISVGIKDHDRIIVRSSGCVEGLEERGKFCSVEGILKNIFQALTSCLTKLSSDNNLNDQRIPIVIQKCAVPISAKGHLSNERRFYKEKRDWIGDFEELGKPFQINLRNWRKNISVENHIDNHLSCNITPRVSEVLKIPAAWAYKQGLRIHFEWVWDAKNIYLVQADSERESGGVDPTKIHRSKLDLLSSFTPKCLKIINETHARQYNKIHNVFTYLKLGLPITRIYILDDQFVIDALASGKVSLDLKSDLTQLVTGSLVIRMDIANADKDRQQLLPRTHEVRELNSALAWLMKYSAEINKCAKEKVAFIFHNFIPSVSSAFAYAAPGERKVLIEGLWGLPEGLYYYEHDKFIVDTQTPWVAELHHKDISHFQVQEKPRCKRYFIASDRKGRWTTQTLKAPYDWRRSINKSEWIREIAFESKRIAEEEAKPLSIMWFVDVPGEVCSKQIFPWHHESYDQSITSRGRTHRKKTPFDRSLVIRSNAEIEILRQEAAKGSSTIRRVRIQPYEEVLLRDKDTLCMIGELTRKIDAVILLEGGVLSHAYYQLMKTNAIVEILHPFEDFDDKREFNKLVRDKVPSNIDRGGEIVRKARLLGDAFLRALREKLAEEAFEVLDATDQNSIIGELADVNEIIDEILCQLGIGRDELRKRQDEKREKAGGFKDGLVLLETMNPLPTKKRKDTSNLLFDNFDHTASQDSLLTNTIEVMELSHTIDKWSDRREHQAVSETILHIVIPTVIDNWIASTQIGRASCRERV